MSDIKRGNSPGKAEEKNMRDNLKKRMKKHAVMTALFFATASWIIGCAKKDAEVSETGTEDFVFTAQDEDADSADNEAGDSGTADGKTKSKKVFVYVCGEVHNPGVYELEHDARVFQAIALAGGATENAAPEAVNQARVIVDGEQIYVPSAEEVQGTGVGAKITERTDDGKININTAGKEELMTLTGVGEAKALSIIAYREEHGGFQSIEELMQIEGIKEGVFNKLKEDITI